MSIPLSVAAILKQHVTLEVESIDRMYLNAYIPRLQIGDGVAGFFRHHRGQPVVSSALMAPISRAFVAAIERFVAAQQVPLVPFAKGQRKDDVAATHLARFTAREGVVFVGKAQEKVRVFRSQWRRNPHTSKRYLWFVKTTALVNQYYFYLVDADFGPLFIKFSSYFPYTAKVCLNGHEYVKRQLAKEGIAFEARDNCIVACANPRRLQALCDGLSAPKIERLFRKWLARLPHPYTAADRAAGYRYDLSILQMECALTQILDRPQTGRVFFEEVIRDHLDLGRPDQVQLIFGRRVTKRTPGRFRTRVLTRGVIPSLHVDYKHTRITQYHKEGHGLRTETTFHNSRDFDIGRRLCNLPALRQVGFTANRRLLDVQRVSHDCMLGEEVFAAVTRPQVVRGQRVAALRFADPRVMALFGALLVFRLLPAGFSPRMLREHLAPLLGVAPAQLSPGRMTYELRRLRLHGLITRIPGTHRYQMTRHGFRIALFFLKVHGRVLRPGVAIITPTAAVSPGTPLRVAFEKLDIAIERWCAHAQIAA